MLKYELFDNPKDWPLYTFSEKLPGKLVPLISTKGSITPLSTSVSNEELGFEGNHS